MLGLIMPPTQRPHALMIELAYHSSWWQTFTALLWFLSDEKQQLWLGFKAQDKGNYAAAINFWRDAGAEGLKFAHALKKGLDIRTKLQTPVDPLKKGFKERKQAISDWARWQTEHPGPRHWKGSFCP